jgi:5-methylcytosine-specific restriction endonuclease McrA
MATQEWQTTRKEIINRDGSCVLCGSTDELQVHHRKYSKPMADKFFSHTHLAVICRQCHEYVTSHQRAERYRIRDLWPINYTPIQTITVVREQKKEMWLI